MLINKLNIKVNIFKNYLQNHGLTKCFLAISSSSILDLECSIQVRDSTFKLRILQICDENIFAELCFKFNDRILTS